jgi:hypothetical protein
MTITNLHTLIDLFNTPEEEGNEYLPLSKIEIPMIQRDYAQGRKSPEVDRIRKRFLSSIYTALTENKPLKLDFVYGDIDNNKVLTPLDGQQRLTTLFLLHWYIARHEDVEVSKMEFLHHFSYETRFSARTFCQHLVDYTPDFAVENLSEDIIDQSWMPLDWKNDPTINAMLNMLDDIHKMFKETSGLWPLLEDGCIGFYFLSIKDMGLTDELYIKMNSRGKPLTEFEHFKAEWEGYMQKLNAEVADRISRKIDLTWTDILWPYKGDNNTIDDEFIKYFRYLCAVIYYKKYPTEQIPEDIFDLTQALFSDKTYEAMDNLLFIEKAFDCLKGFNIKHCFDTFLTLEQHIDNKSHVDEPIDVFEQCCRKYGDRSSQKRAFSIGRMLLLYCFILYWQNKTNISEEQFRNRLRIINNLIKSSEFELREDRMSALLEQIDEIVLEGKIEIIEGRNTFNAFQVQEEMEKKEWRNSHPDKELLLQKLEDHPLLEGCIRVVGWDNLDYTDRFYSLFQCDRGLVNRALLTLGDYSIKVNRRYQIGSANIDTSWKAIFHSNKDSIKDIQAILLQLLAKAEVFTDDVLRGVIDEYLAETTHYDWKYYLVKYDSMRPEKYGMYYWYEYDTREKASYNILMMMTETNISLGRNFQIFLKALYDKFVATYPDRAVRLGEYAYSGDGDKLELLCINKRVYFTDNQFVIEASVENTGKIPPYSITISQENGIDTVDRINVAWKEIKQLMTIE